MYDQRGSSVGWSLWLWWVVASAIGTAGGWAAVMAIVLAIDVIVGGEVGNIFGIVATLTLGLVGGCMQWLVLRRRIPRAERWIAASVAGYVVVGILAPVANGLVASRGMWDDAVPLLVLGVVVGLPQWLALRQHLARAGWWVLASAFQMIGYLVGAANPASTYTEAMVLGAIVGTISGATTGGVLLWLLQPLASDSLTSGASAC